MRKKLSILLFPALLLGLLTACGGGSTNNPTPITPVTPPGVPATGFAYTDPTGDGWRLLKDSSSTPARIVLNLVGPMGTKSRGVGFNLKAPDSVTFGTFPNDWHAQDTGVFQLLNYHRVGGEVPYSPEPVYFAAGVKPGNALTVGIFQKDRMIDAKVVSKPLVQIALEFDALKAKNLSAGDVLSLAVTKAKHIPEDIGTISADGVSDFAELITKSRVEVVQIAVGSLKAQ